MISSNYIEFFLGYDSQQIEIWADEAREECKHCLEENIAHCGIDCDHEIFIQEHIRQRIRELEGGKE